MHTVITVKEDLDFKNEDLMLGRSFYLNLLLTIVLSIGIKGTWQSFEHKIVAESTVSIPTTINRFNTSYPVYRSDKEKIKDNNKIWGIAIAAALDFYFYILECISIYGSLSVAGFF